ncbi:MAG: cytochrome c family protein [Planctomycetes bacterium]|nr:cytochrome c family protein [Planctomycetota bacterium]
MRRLVGLAAAVTVLASATWFASAESPDSSRRFASGTSLETGARAQASSATFLFRGARSCAAAACHGDPDASRLPSEAWRRSFLTWVEDDPHSQSHRSLESPEGLAMMERLRILVGGRMHDRRGYANCVACHDPTPPPIQRRQSYFVGDGVGCEHCHGPADAWISRHYTAGWDRDSLAELGMTRTHELPVRAALCADCHVGGPGREVNHDMLAAGHPPLRFEFAAFLDRLPKHWDENRERIVHENFELQTWLAGQAASAEASLRLLEARAARAGVGDAAWPEFAEYDCVACHHDLTPNGWRPNRDSDRTPATLSWGTWHFPLFERLTAASDDPAASPVNALRDAMASSLLPDPAVVQEHAEAARMSHRRRKGWPALSQTSYRWCPANPIFPFSFRGLRHG